MIRFIYFYTSLLFTFSGCIEKKEENLFKDNYRPSLMLPKRSNDALAGSELETILSSLDLRDRENYILSEILSGNIPEFLRSFVPVTFNTQHKDIKKTITFFVLSDYMAIGNNNDYFMIPMTPILAQKIASSLRLSFLTKKMVDLVWGSSILKLDPIPIPPSPEMTTIPVFGLHNRLIYQKRSANFENHKPGVLVAGHKKDVIISNRIKNEPEKVIIYGWHRINGNPIQPIYSGHAVWYVDYSHGIRLAYNECIINKDKSTITDILNNDEYYYFFSDESGPMEITKYSTDDTNYPLTK
tara:strand:+ start:22918 stop:23811 length:894 start_codon:yes stop_codon:yes gene_type:complete